jgi:hypothetical protein
VADLDAVFAGRGEAQSVSNAGLRARIRAILSL